MTMPAGENSRQAQVTVSANVDPFVQGMNLATKSANTFASALQKIDQTVLKITKVAGAGLMIGGGAGLLAGLLGSKRDIADAAAFETQMHALTAQSTLTGTSIAGLGANLRKLSTDIPMSTTALASLATQIAAVGVRGTAQITNFTRAAAELARATNTAPGQLFTQLVSMSQALGNGLENVQRYGSSLTDLQAKMGVSAQGIMDFSGGIQAVANKAGVGQASILGLSAAFQKVGADGFAGAQAFNTVMNDMADAVARGNSRMQLYASTLGMTADAFAKLFKNNPAQAFVNFVNAIASQGDKAQMVLEQFGLDSVRTQRVFAALTSGQANLQQALNQSNAAFTQNSASAQAAAVAWGGFNDAAQRLKNTMTGIHQVMGEPMLQLLTPMTDMLNGVAKAALSAVTAIEKIPLVGNISGWTMVAAGVTLAAGAFAVLAASAAKALGVWRLLTGVVGGSAIRGMWTGARGGDMAENQGASRTQLAMYSTGYRAGTALRPGRGTPITGLDELGNVAHRGLGTQVAMFPVTRARQMWAQTSDTMRHPFNANNRNPLATDPWSFYGMEQSTERWAGDRQGQLAAWLGRPGASQFEQNLAPRVAQPFGPVASSGTRLRYDRARATSSAYNAAREAQQKQIGRMSRGEQNTFLSATEAEMYAAQGVTDYTPRDPAVFGRRQRSRALAGAADWRGQMAAGVAGDQFNAKLSDQQTAQLANPFQKLAAKVKTISAEMTADTAAATQKVMGSIETTFAAAINRITKLAQQAKAQLSSLEVQAYGPTKMTGLPPVPATAHGMTGSGAFQQEVVNRMTGMPPVPTTTRTAEQIASSVVVKGSNAAAGEEITQESSKVATALRTGGEKIGSTLGRLGSSLFAFVSSPWMMGLMVMGPLLGEAIGWINDKLKQITPREALPGAEVQQALGRQYMTPDELAKQQAQAQSNNADKNPFGPVEAANAKSPNFLAAHAQSVGQIGQFSGNNAQLKQMFQQQVNALITQNGGGPLDSAQQQQIRELAIAVTGDPQAAQSLLKSVNFTGGSVGSLYSAQANSLYGSNKGFSTWGAGKSKLNAMTGAATMDYQAGNTGPVAYLLSRAAKEGKSSPWDVLGNQYMNVLNTTNEGKADNEKIKPASGSPANFNDMINKLRGGNAPAQAMADQITGQLRAAGVQVDNLGHVADLTAADLDKLAQASSSAAVKTKEQTEQEKARMATQANQIYRGVNPKDATGDIGSMLQNPQDVWFNANLRRVNEEMIKWQGGAGQFNGPTSAPNGGTDVGITSPKFITGLQNAIIQIEKLKSTLKGPSDPAWQELDKLEQMNFSRMSTAASITMMPQDQGVLQAKTLLKEISAAPVNSSNVDSYQAQADKIVDIENDLASRLRAAYANHLEVQKQEQRAAEDHNRQMLIMQRDYNIQMGEMLYQFNIQQREASYQFGIQQRESVYQFQISQREALYSFNIQQRESQYQYAIGQREAEYQFEISRRESLYNFAYDAAQRQHSFDESIRATKYSLANAFGNAGSIVQAQYTSGATSALAGAAQQNKLFQESLDTVQKLTNMGLSQDAIRIFKLDDPTNVAQAKRFLTDFLSNPELVKAFNDSVAQRLNLTNAIASSPNSTSFVELKRQFDYAAEQAGIQFQHAQTLANESFTHSMALAAESFTHAADVAAESFDHSQQLATESFAHGQALASESFAHSTAVAAESFQHQTEMSAQSFANAMSDFQTAYDISMARLLQDEADNYRLIQMGVDQLIQWGNESGIPGLQDMAGKLQAIANMMDQVNTQLEQARQTSATIAAAEADTLKGLENGAWLAGYYKATMAGGTTPNYNVPAPQIPGLPPVPGGANGGLFDTGGFTGSGGKYQAAGVVHKGEFVEPAEAVSFYGVDIMEAIRQRKIPKDLFNSNGFAAGGGVGSGAFYNAVADITTKATGSLSAYTREVSVNNTVVSQSNRNRTDFNTLLDAGNTLITAALKNLTDLTTLFVDGQPPVLRTTEALTDYDKIVDSANKSVDQGTDATKSYTEAVTAAPAKVATLSHEVATGTNVMDKGTGSANLLTQAIDTIPKDPTITFRIQTAEAMGALREMIQAVYDATWAEVSIVNTGIINSWNYVVGKMGLPATLAVGGYSGDWIATVPTLPAGFATGGEVPGWSPGDEDDSVPAKLTPGEFVVRKKVAQRHRNFLTALNDGQGEAVQAAGGLDARGPGGAQPGNGAGSIVPRKGLRGYAGGGNVDEMMSVGQAMHGKPYIWGGASPAGADCSGFMSIMINAVRGEANPYFRLGTTETMPWGGMSSGYGAYTLGNHRDPSGHTAGTFNGINAESGGAHGNVAWGPPAAGADDPYFYEHWFLSEFAGQFAPGGAAGAPAFDPIAYLRDELNKALPAANGKPMEALIKAAPTKLLDHVIARIQELVAQTQQTATGSGNIQDIVRAVANGYGWGTDGEWDALSNIISRESSWNPNAQNSSSTAYGLFQFLDSTWASVGATKTADPNQQAIAGMKYIQQRYNDPIGAWNFWQAHNWYSDGAIFDRPQMIGVGENGPEAVLPLNGKGSEFMAATVRSVLSRMGMDPDITEGVNRGRSTQYASSARSEMHYYHTDASTNFNGEITVVSNDPNEFAAKLRARQRLDRLTHPVARR